MKIFSDVSSLAAATLTADQLCEVKEVGRYRIKASGSGITLANGNIAVPVASGTRIRVEHFGAKGNGVDDDAAALTSAIAYAQSITSDEYMITLDFDKLTLFTPIVIDTYSAPFRLKGNLISYKNSTPNTTAITVGEDLSSNGIMRIVLEGFSLNNDSGQTQTNGIHIQHCAYHKMLDMEVNRFDTGILMTSCVGAIHDFNNREFTNTTNNIKTAITGTRKNNLYTLKNLKNKLDSAGVAVLLDYCASSTVEHLTFDVLPTGTTPLRIQNSYEQTERNAIHLSQLWFENYGDQPVYIDDSIVYMENVMFAPLGTPSYCIRVGGLLSKIDTYNVFSTSAVQDYIVFFDTDMAWGNLIECNLDNTYGGTSIPSCNKLQQRSYTKKTFAKQLQVGGNANSYVFDLVAFLNAEDFRLKFGGESGSVTLKFMGRTGVAVDYAEYELALATKGYGGVSDYYVEDVRPTWSTVNKTFGTISHITVTFPVSRQPVFTFAASGNGATGFANLTVLLEYNEAASKYMK